MAGRRGTLSVSAANSNVPTKKDEEELPEIVETSAESVNSAASNTASSDSSSEKLKTVSEDGDNMSTSVGSASSNSAETSSSSSGSEPGGIKPSEQELVQETSRIRDEKTELKISLSDDKLILLERRIAEMEKGEDTEWKERLAETKEAQEKKISVAKERLRMSVESINSEYQATIEQILEELKNAKAEISLAQEAKYRVRAEHHATKRMAERTHAGHEFPRHVEYNLPKDQIEADLLRMKVVSNTSSSTTPKLTADMDISLPPTSLRKHSLKDEIMGEEGLSQSSDAEGNPYRLSKIRRKSR